MAAVNLPDETKRAVLEALRGGMSLKRAAREFGISERQVKKIAVEGGWRPAQERTKTARAVLASVSTERRVKLLRALLAKAGELLPAADTPQKLQSLATATAIVVDKIRLETGEATARTEMTERRVYEITQRLVTDRAAVELHERLLERLSGPISSDTTHKTDYAIGSTEQPQT